MTITDIQPLLFAAATALIVGLLWALIRGGVKAAAGFVVLGGVLYAGTWLVSGEQPFQPAEFGAWLDALPDTIGSWIEKARSWVQ